jgi:hypothetical protein
MPYEKNPDEIGALWIKTSRNGVEFMSGTVNGVDVVCFRSKSKSDKAPAWNVLKSKPKDGERPMHNANAPSDADDSIPY